MVPTPKAVRVKTSDGWQDIAIQGPQGPPSGQMVLIEDKIVIANGSPISFQNIPQTFRHLYLIGSMRSNQAVLQSGCTFRINNDSGPNYYYERIDASLAALTAAASSAVTAGEIGAAPGSSDAAGNVASFGMFLPNYAAGVGALKRVWQAECSMWNFIRKISGLWAGTAPITRLDLLTPSAGWDIPTQVSLYGIKAEPEGIRQNWSDVYCETTLGITNLGAIAANGLWTLLPIPAAPKLIITKADGVNDDFTRNADGTITINKAGNYHISCSLGAGDQWADGVNINYGIAKKAGVQPGAGDTWVATDNRTAGATGNNYPGGTVAGTTFCNAGDRIAIWLWHNAGATKPINLHTFSIHRTGAGPPGPVGTPFFATTGRFAGNGGTVGAGGQHIGGNSLVYTPTVPVRAQINWKSRWDKVDANWGYCAGGPVFSPLPVADYDGLDAAPVLGQRVLRDLLSGYGGADPYKTLKGTFFVDLAANVTYTIMNSFYAGAGTWQWDSSWAYNHIDLMAWPR